jgi:hypothetical protein
MVTVLKDAGSAVVVRAYTVVDMDICSVVVVVTDDS